MLCTLNKRIAYFCTTLTGTTGRLVNNLNSIKHSYCTFCLGKVVGPPALDRCFRSRQFISMSDFDTLAVTDSDLRQARCIPFMWSSGFTTNFGPQQFRLFWVLCIISKESSWHSFAQKQNFKQD